MDDVTGSGAREDKAQKWASLNHFISLRRFPPSSTVARFFLGILKSNKDSTWYQMCLHSPPIHLLTRTLWWVDLVWKARAHLCGFPVREGKKMTGLTWCLKHSLRPSSKQSSLDCVWGTWQPYSGTGSTAQKQKVGRSFLGSSLDVQFREESWAVQELNKQWLGRGCSKKFKAKSLVGN